jgi:hypothetical protein
MELVSYSTHLSIASLSSVRLTYQAEIDTLCLINYNLPNAYANEFVAAEGLDLFRLGAIRGLPSMYLNAYRRVLTGGGGEQPDFEDCSSFPSTGDFKNALSFPGLSYMSFECTAKEQG